MARHLSNLPSVLRPSGALLLSAALFLGACGSSDEVVSEELPSSDATLTLDSIASEDAGQDLDEVTSDAPEALAVTDETTPAPTTTTEALPVADSNSTTVEAPPNNDLGSTTTTDPAPVIVRPERVGAVVSEEQGLMVVTAVDDPLNVRVGPGVEYAVIGQLDHRTGQVDTTHGIQVSPDNIWMLVSIGGEELGWVHSNFLVTPSTTESCTAQAMSTVNASLALTAVADVDLDQLPDDVEVYVGERQDGTAVMWVEVQFANGGTSSGIAATANSLSHFPGFMQMRITGLNYLAGGSPAQEIAVTTAQGASHSGWTVLSLDTCEFVETTLDGAPFGFSLGASAIASSAGCSYGAHGETTFSRTTIDFNSQTWSQTFYELRGVEWTEYTTQTGTGVQAPSDSWDDCGGVTVN